MRTMRECWKFAMTTKPKQIGSNQQFISCPIPMELETHGLVFSDSDSLPVKIFFWGLKIIVYSLSQFVNRLEYFSMQGGWVQGPVEVRGSQCRIKSGCWREIQRLFLSQPGCFPWFATSTVSKKKYWLKLIATALRQWTKFPCHTPKQM